MDLSGECIWTPFKAHFRRLHARAFVVTACWWRARCKSPCDIGALPQHIAADGHSSDPSIHRRPRSNARKTCSSGYDSWILADARMNVQNDDSLRTGALLPLVAIYGSFSTVQAILLRKDILMIIRSLQISTLHIRVL